MTSKRRFTAACAHTNPDRVPINYLAKPDIDARIREFYGVTTEKELLEALGQGGGYVYASCNSLQSDTPVENIDAMYRAAREHKL